MYVLGLSFDFHDAAAALLCDGDIVAASTEERHTRRKHDPAFPANAIAFCLEQAGITAAQLEQVVFYERPGVKFDRILRCSLVGWRRGGLRQLKQALDSWARQGKFEVAARIARHLQIPESRISFVDHHQSHAASAYYCSAFDEATVVTLDGVGEWETGTIGAYRQGRLRKLHTIDFPHSLGLFYSVFTAYLGFEVNEGEYKVMGLAGYGRPIYRQRLLDLFRLAPDGTFRVDQKYFAFDHPGACAHRQSLVDWLGPARQSEAPFGLAAAAGGAEPSPPGSDQHYADIAASVQAATETVVEHVVTAAIAETGINRLCLAGGVALNSLANQRLRKKLGCPMFVQPAAGDAGGALGAAQAYLARVQPRFARRPMVSAALGPGFAHDEILRQVEATYAGRYRHFADAAELCEAVARLLAAEKVIGWFHGRAEWGPRALGHRSILASAAKPHMQALVNEKIKFREPFRPFAPAVVATRAAEYFDICRIDDEDEASNPYNFMLAVCEVRPEARALIPAVTHVDGTARVQLVRRDNNPRFFDLLTAFGRLSGVPILLNTSFNLRGEPIVSTPRDAIDTFEYTEMDALVLEDFVIEKRRR